MSGYQDSNLGPPAPKAGALPDCATSRKLKRQFARTVSRRIAATANCRQKVRMGRDSNPRYELTPYDGLANRWFQPLTHPSERGAKILQARWNGKAKSPTFFSVSKVPLLRLKSAQNCPLIGQLPVFGVHSVDHDREPEAQKTKNSH